MLLWRHRLREALVIVSSRWPIDLVWLPLTLHDYSGVADQGEWTWRFVIAGYESDLLRCIRGRTEIDHPGCLGWVSDRVIQHRPRCLETLQRTKKRKYTLCQILTKIGRARYTFSKFSLKYRGRNHTIIHRPKNGGGVGWMWVGGGGEMAEHI